MEVEKLLRKVLNDPAVRDRPLSQGLRQALDSGRYEAFTTQVVDPRRYTNAREYWLDVCLAKFVSKCVDLPLQVDRAEAAKKNWRAGEVACYRTNVRLAPYYRSTNLKVVDDLYSPAIHAHLRGIRKIVRRVLGDAPPDLVEGRFGPGATFSDPSVRSTAADKMNSVTSLTSGAVWFLPQWYGTLWGRANALSARDPVFVRGNRFATAPKDATKDRAIAAEPSVNVYYQLAYGRLIRQRLKRVGIDLDHGQDTHRRLAREASISGHLATIDLRNASDTMSSGLVKLLLPPAWFEVLNALRSTHTRLDGSWVRLEKFSSMGNGFTFELESLIFYAICAYVTATFGVQKLDRRVVFKLRDGEVTRVDVPEPLYPPRVYGDDLIVDSTVVEPLLPLLAFLGFEVNSEKSFTDGPFRESCGGDYFNGEWVRPFYVKQMPSSPRELITLANKIYRVASKLDAFWSVWFFVLDHLPTNIRRLRGPRVLGDMVIHDDDCSRWQFSREKDGIRYLRCLKGTSSVRSLVPLHIFDDDVQLATVIYGVVQNVSFGPRTFTGLWPREPVIDYEITEVPFS